MKASVSALEILSSENRSEKFWKASQIKPSCVAVLVFFFPFFFLTSLKRKIRHFITLLFGAQLNFSSPLHERRPKTQRPQLPRMRYILQSGMLWTCVAWRTGLPWCAVGRRHTSHLTALGRCCHDNDRSSKRLSCLLPLRLVVGRFPSCLLRDQRRCHAMLLSMSRVPVSLSLCQDVLEKVVKFLLRQLWFLLGKLRTFHSSAP